MASKRIEKFAIRRRADAVTKHRRTLERIDKELRRHYRAVTDVDRIVEEDGILDGDPTTHVRRISFLHPPGRRDLP